MIISVSKELKHQHMHKVQERLKMCQFSKSNNHGYCTYGNFASRKQCESQAEECFTGKLKELTCRKKAGSEKEARLADMSTRARHRIDQKD